MSEGDNIEDLNELIGEVAATVIELLAQRKAVQERISEAKARVKARGITMTDFNVALRLKQLEAEDRVKSIEGLKVCFAALDIGGQSDLFPAGDG